MTRRDDAPDGEPALAGRLLSFEDLSVLNHETGGSPQAPAEEAEPPHSRENWRAALGPLDWKMH